MSRQGKLNMKTAMLQKPTSIRARFVRRMARLRGLMCPCLALAVTGMALLASPDRAWGINFSVASATPADGASYVPVEANIIVTRAPKQVGVGEEPASALVGDGDPMGYAALGG